MADEETAADVAQVAHNHLTLQIRLHLDGTCRCKKIANCRKRALAAVDVAAKVMRSIGAERSPTANHIQHSPTGGTNG